VPKFSQSRACSWSSQRSLEAIIHRFVARCQWHDRDRLRKVADDAKRSEDALVLATATWFFDQGFSPITWPSTGGLRPDLLDGSGKRGLYIEAKQYKAKNRTFLLNGYAEIHDHIKRLAGTPYEIAEAFYVIFRRGGPLYQLPPVIQENGFKLFCVVVDIGALETSGSSNKFPPELITEEELRAGPQRRKSRRQRK
jgi:hypothetical protein